MKIPTIKTKSFLLRPFHKGDEFSLAKNINDRDIGRNNLHIPYPYTLKYAREWIAKKSKQGGPHFAIVSGNEVIGGIGLKLEGHKAEVGYWLGKKYRNRGITTKAVSLITNYGFKKLKLLRMYAHVFPGNEASVKVLKKNGYVYEGLIRGNSIKNGKLMNDLQFAKVR